MSNKGKKFLDLDQLASFFSTELDKKLEPLMKEVKHITNYLKKFPDFIPLATAKSLKQITERGNELLKKHNVDSYIDENCLLLKDEKLEDKTDAQIFIEASKWVDTKGKEKLVEIMLNSDIPENLIKELLALSILYKIKKSISDK